MQSRFSPFPLGLIEQEEDPTAAEEAETQLLPPADDSRPQPQAPAADGEPDGDWQERKRRQRADMLAWSLSDPFPRLVVLREVLGVMVGVIALFLQLSGEKWTRRQESLAAQQQKRSYRVLEAARGTGLQQAFSRLLRLLHSVPRGLCAPATCVLRGLRYRLLAACACSLQAYLRVVRAGAPYSLFLVLDGKTSPILNAPQCMLDPLSRAFLAIFTDSAALSSVACLAMLEALASQYELDIAAVEAAHSTSREFTKLRSRGWTPSLEAVSAKFVQRMSSWATSTMPTATAKGTSRRAAKEVRRSQKFGGRIGGGPWRAFVHERASGHKLGSAGASPSELKTAYHALAPEEKRRYQLAGEAATAAHRLGHTPFPRSRDQRHAGHHGGDERIPASAAALQDVHEPGSRTASGAIVAADVQSGGSLQVRPYTGVLFEEQYSDFKNSLKRPVDALALTKEEEQRLQRQLINFDLCEHVYRMHR